jgi:hypothetical protein
MPACGRAVPLQTSMQAAIRPVLPIARPETADRISAETTIGALQEMCETRIRTRQMKQAPSHDSVVSQEEIVEGERRRYSACRVCFLGNVLDAGRKAETAEKPQQNPGRASTVRVVRVSCLAFAARGGRLVPGCRVVARSGSQGLAPQAEAGRRGGRRGHHVRASTRPAGGLLAERSLARGRPRSGPKRHASPRAPNRRPRIGQLDPAVP